MGWDWVVDMNRVLHRCKSHGWDFLWNSARYDPYYWCS